jgi:hypothetical protein
MKPAPTAAANPAAPDLRKSPLACFATKEQGNHLVLSSTDAKAWKVPLPCGKSRSIAAPAAPIHRVRLIPLGQITMLARQAGDPIPPGVGFWEKGTLRPESVAGK